MVPAIKCRFSWLACAVAALPVSAAEDACSLTMLPETGIYRHSQAQGALVTAHYPDPRKLANDYTGCLQVWVEINGNAQPFMIGRFVDGKVRTISIPPIKLECAYQDRALKIISGVDQRRCPPTTEGMELETWQK